MTKDQIRSLMRQSNSNIDAMTRREAAISIFNTIERLPEFITARCVAIYAALPDEIPTRRTIAQWVAQGHRVVIPRVTNSTEMEFFDYDPTKMTTGAFGIDEPPLGEAISPDEIDLIIIPGVAFCSDGRRLGRGRGYYDRYLSRKGFRGYKIGVCYKHQLLNSVPYENHDVTLDRIIPNEPLNLESTIPSIILSVVEAAGVDATRLGCSVEYLNSIGLSWVLLRYSMTLTKAPAQGEKIEIETWISECSRVTSTRNFIIRNTSGETIGEAATVWCIIDMTARKALPLTSAHRNYAEFVQQRDHTISIPRRLPEIDPDAPTIETQHSVTYDDLDFNNHVNTIRYIEMMLEMLPRDRQNRLAKSHTDIQFLNESRLGDTLTIKHQEQPLACGKKSLFETLRQDGTLSVKALFEWSE